MIKDIDSVKLLENFEIEVTEDLVLMDEGIYDVVLIKLEKLRNFGMEDSFLRWTFRTRIDQTGGIHNIELQAKSSFKLTSESKALRWIEKLLGREIKVGEHIHTSDLIGKSCQVCVEHVPKITKMIETFD